MGWGWRGGVYPPLHCKHSSGSDQTYERNICCTSGVAQGLTPCLDSSIKIDPCVCLYTLRSLAVCIVLLNYLWFKISTQFPFNLGGSGCNMLLSASLYTFIMAKLSVGDATIMLSATRNCHIKWTCLENTYDFESVVYHNQMQTTMTNSQWCFKNHVLFSSIEMQSRSK